MASWNDVTEGSQLAQCPVCLCHVAKKKKLTHTLDCYQNKKEQMDELGVIQCPVSNQHILPKIFLNHHLEGNCQEALNLLRKFYQKKGLLENFRGAPPDYDPGISEEFLNAQNRDLLYLLDEDMFGEFMRDFDKAQQQEEEEAARQQPPNGTSTRDSPQTSESDPQQGQSNMTSSNE